MAESMETFLEAAGLSKHAESIAKAGFNDVAVLRNLAKQDLESLVKSVQEAAGMEEAEAELLKAALEAGAAADASASADAAGAGTGDAGADGGAGAGGEAGGAGGSGAATATAAARAKSEPNWSAMPAAMLGTYLNTVLTDKDAKRDESWAANGLAEIAKRSDTHDQAVLEELATTGVVMTTITALGECGEDLVVVRHALKALRCMARSSANKTMIAGGSGIDLIVKAMTAFPEDAALQEAACATLVNVGGVEAFQPKLGEAGAGAVIIAAMKKHRLNVGVVWAALAALRNMTINDANQERVAEDGGIKAIANALGAHRARDNINEMGCGALRNLAVNEVNRTKLLEQGAISALALALTTHKDNAAVQASALGALANMLVDSSTGATHDEMTEAMSMEGTAALAKAAREAHSKDDDVKAQANAVLTVLEPGAVKKSVMGGIGSRIFGKK